MTDSCSATGTVMIPAKTAMHAGSSIKILLVDDQADNLLSAEAVLEGLGEEIIKAQSGAEALRYLLDNDVAVILLDIMMPDMDGFECASLIRQRERSKLTPIIFLTALGRGQEHVLQGYSLGAVDYIVKPFIPEVLRSKVSVFVELNRQAELLQKQAALLESRNVELQQAILIQKQADHEIQALNDHLERRIAELAEVNKELEAFSYSVSHDLRGPLSRISGFSKALVDFHGNSLNDEGHLYLKRIGDSATRACELVDDLLNFSRITRVELRREIVDLSDIVRSVAAELENRDHTRGVEFTIADQIRVSADPGLVKAVVLNLMENAWKFTNRQAKAHIEFGVERRQEGPVYFVRDNGAGFDMSDAHRLFTPFQRLHAVSEFPGTGIGLAIVDRVVRRHGGRAWAEGERGRGAVFYFTLQPEVAS